MSSTNRPSLRVGVLGILVGFVPAVWLAGLVRATPDAPTAAPPTAATTTPVPNGDKQSDQAAITAAQQELRAQFPLQVVGGAACLRKD